MTLIPKPNRKIGIVDKHAIGVSLEVAAVAIDPDEYTFRSVFKEMMPKLYVMRQRGMSFGQLHRVLNQAGFPIAQSTVRTYYNECLLEMLDECQKYLKRMERVIDGAEKVVEVDRTSEMRARKQAFRSAVSEEAKRRAVKTMDAFAAVPSKGEPVLSEPPGDRPVDASAPPETSSEPVEGSTGTDGKLSDLRSGDPLMGSRTATPPPTPPASTVNADKVLRPQQPSPALVAPVAAANAAPSRVKPAAAPGSAYCLTVPTDQQIEAVAGVPSEVLGNDVLEHPAIPGLMLTRQQRLYVGRLEYRGEAGVDSVEKGTELMNRREWKQGVPVSVGRTSSDFVELDTSVIGRRPKHL